MKKIIIITFLIIFSMSNTFALEESIDKKIEKIYNNFYSSLKHKKNKIDLLKYLDKKIEKIFHSSKKNKQVLFDLLRLNKEKIFLLEQEKIVFEKRLPNYEFLSNYKKIYNSDYIFKEDGIWYFYDSSGKYFFPDEIELNEKILESNGLKQENTIVLFDKNGVSFVTDFKKIKLISDKYIYGFPNKSSLLKTIKNNKIFNSKIKKDDDSYFGKLKKKSLELTKGIQKKEDKIKVLYAFILKNTYYKKDFSIEDEEIFSGIDTFKNGYGVCEGYVELLNLMLGFNGIKSEIITGDVIDADDFPQIGHAWLKIGEFYYDITFDDPIGQEEIKDFKDYKFYKIPKDLFYANRFDKGETPENLKSTSMEYRKKLIESNLYKLSGKYKENNFNILKPYIFRKKHSITSDKITLNDIKKIYNFQLIKENYLMKNGEKKYIKNLEYIELTNENINDILYMYNFDLDSKKLYIWEKDGINMYIIMKNISFYD